MRFLVALSAFLSLSAHALELPDCWTADGKKEGRNARGEDIVDGQWLVQVDLERISKEDLVKIMTKVKRGNLNHAAYPTIFEPDYMLLQVEAKDDTKRVARQALKQRVAAQLGEIIAHSAVPSVECNGINSPAN
jgi:hypothetical protein